MGLPQQLKTARMTDATIASTVDNEVGALELALCDIFGFTPDVDITASALSIDNEGRINKPLVAQRAPAPVGWRFRNTTNNAEFRLVLDNVSILIDENTGTEGAPVWANRITIALATGIFSLIRADRLAVTKSSVIALAAGSNNDLAIGNVGLVKLAPDAAGSTITGIAGGSDGRIIFVFTTNSSALTYAHDSGSSVAANRLYMRSSVDYGPFSFVYRAVAFVYDSALSRWVQVLRN